jgi:hypothetical protein
MWFFGNRASGKRRRSTVTATEETQQAIEDYLRLVKEKEELDTAVEKAKARVIELAAVKGQKSMSATIGNKRVVATVSSRTVTRFNEEGLKKALGAISYKRLCKLVIDRRKVEEEVVKGSLDPVIVAQYTTIETSAPYIRLSEKAVDDD